MEAPGANRPFTTFGLPHRLMQALDETIASADAVAM